MIIDIVRCQECKFASTNATVMTDKTIMRCNVFRAMTEPNGYCYKGERKDTETYDVKDGVRITI